jgi:2-oxoglutarate dehydrogenase E2 component (dihydrolipoamide succinyltransferase)
MLIEVTVPNLPESVSDATLLDWHKQPGDPVKRADHLVDLETDKVVLEVPVPENGILQEVRHTKGDVVASGDLLAVIETDVKSAIMEPSPTPTLQEKLVSLTQEPAPEMMEAVSVSESPLKKPEFTLPLSPAVRRLLMEHHLDPAQISGTGREGRLTKQDVLDFLQTRATLPAATVTLTEEPQSVAPNPAVRSQAATIQKDGERRVPMTRLRARIAERMVEAQQTTATLTTFNEVNLQKVFDLRNQYRTRFEQEHQVKLGFMSFFVKAVVAGLKRFPIVNATIEGTDIVYHDYYDIGIAVSTERGLIVPILRNADRLNFSEIEKAVADFSKRGRDGKLSFEDLSGGTFTITNGGIFGSMLSTPILNPPQSAILGMHAIKDRPVVEDGQIVVRPMIYLALSYDHRIIDGREAVSFLFLVKEMLEDPCRLLLNV